MRYMLHLLALLGALGGSIAASSSLAEDQVPQLRKIGVVSAIGDKFLVWNHGPFFVNEAKFEIDIGDWAIDKRILDGVASAELGDAVVSLDVMPEFYNENADKIFSALSSKGFVDIDTVLIVSKAQQYDVPILGLGAIHSVGDDDTYIFTNYRIDCFDAHSGKRLTRVAAFDPVRKTIELNFGANAMKGTLSDDERQALRIGTEQQIDKTLGRALPRLHLNR